TQNRTPQCTARLAHLLGREIPWQTAAVGEQYGIGQQRVVEEQAFLFFGSQARNRVAGIAFGVVLLLELSGDDGFAEVGASVKPGFGPNGRYGVRRILVVRLRKRAAL